MTMMQRPLRLAALSLALAAAPLIAHAETLPVAGGAVSTELSGTVTVVNQEKRMLTLKTADGRFEVLHMPMEVKRLDEIKVGNRVTITATDLVLVDLHKAGGTIGVRSDSAVVRDGGEKPSGMMVDSVTITGVVQAVDLAQSSVTIKGPRETLTFQAKDPAVLAEVAPGDSVSLSYLRAIRGEVKVR